MEAYPLTPNLADSSMEGSVTTMASERQRELKRRTKRKEESRKLHAKEAAEASGKKKAVSKRIQPLRPAEPAAA